jgi:DNA-binding SARP family transcriptional activator/tetratricopeptide (TPR) repeat protein
LVVNNLGRSTLLSLRTFGALDLRDDETRLLADRRKPLALLAYLARRAPRPATRESLAALLWPTSDEALSRQSLRQTLSELRSAVGDALVSDGAMTHVTPERVTLDATLFERDVAGQRWSDATARWTGDFLAGLDDLGDDSWRSWLEGERAGLRAQLAIAFANQAKAAQARGDWAAATAVATQWRAALPADERAAVHLVNALRYGGRTVEATARYAECLTQLRDETGAEPSPAFMQLGAELGRSDAPPSPGARALMTPDMVGRENAFAALTSAWAGARAGTGRVVVVQGDEGTGKTRLLREFVRYVRAQKQVSDVLESRAFAVERDHPFAALRPWVAQLAEAPGLGGSPPEVLAVLGQIAPEVREVFRHLPDADRAGDVAEAFQRAVTDAAAERPLLLVLDDAPECDAESAKAVAALVRRPPARTLVVLSGRTDAWRESRLTPDLDQASEHVERVELLGLREEEALAMLASIVPLDPGHATTIASKLFQASGGNPAQLVQLFTHLADRGVIAPDAEGRWSLAAPTDPGDFPLPLGLRDAFIARQEQLGANARTLLDAAAVAGPRVSSAMLESIARLSAPDYQEALGELLAHRILSAADGGRGDSGTLAFTSEASRRTVYDRVAPSRRRTLERRMAGQRGWFSHRWARLATAAAVVFATLGAVVVARNARGVVKPGSLVLLADVQNLTGDGVFDRALLTAATVGLQQSRQVTVYPRARVSQTLARMLRSRADTLFSEALAREVAEREGVPIVIVLAIAQLDSVYDLTARLVEPRSGRDLRALQERARGKSDVLAGMDRLLGRTRRALGESADSVNANASPLPRVTTASLEALRAYAEGQRAWAARDMVGAAALFTQAVTIDSSFALALSSLADYAYFYANDRRLGDRYLDRAEAAKDRLTERERLELQAREEQYRGTPARNIEILKLLAERFPQRESWFNYGTSLMRARQCGDAMTAFQRAISLDSMFTNALINVATCQQFMGKYREAVASYAQARRTDSTALVRGTINHEFGLALVHLGLVDSARAVYRAMIARAVPDDKRRGYRSLAYVLLLVGRSRAAAAALDSAVMIDQATDNRTSAFRDDGILAQVAQLAGDGARARAALNGAWELLRHFTPDPAFAFYVGHDHANARSFDRARLLLDTLVARSRTTSTYDQTERRILEGRIALASGRARDARTLLAQATDTTLNGFRLGLFADTYEALGAVDSALTAAEQLAREERVGDEQQFEWLRGQFLVGRLAERKGDVAKARAAYAAFAERWKQGDADHPLLVEARRALARLTAP